jgi:hypothetical protein
MFLGDVGQWLPNGSLKIIDRKKHIFKLSQGEYVVPEIIEHIYLRSPYIAQAFVHGDALKVSFSVMRSFCIFTTFLIVLLLLLCQSLKALISVIEQDVDLVIFYDFVKALHYY